MHVKYRVKTKTIHYSKELHYTTPGLQITTNLISQQHELHTMEHTPLERKQQKHGIKSKEREYLIY